MSGPTWHESQGIRWIEYSLDGCRVCFTTRAGGTSEGPHSSLNLGFATGDDPGRVLENRRRLMAALKLGSSGLTWARQVHGNVAQVHNPPFEEFDFAQTPEQAQPQAEADAQVVPHQGPGSLVFVADCLPVAISGDTGRAMVHCGWRPMAAGIVEHVAGLTGAHSAVIGPGIGPCCYEVDEDVRAQFRFLDADAPRSVFRGRRLDLAEAAERLLRRAGISDVQRTDACTSCDREHFFSHRRDRGVTGRQAGLIFANG